MDNMYICPICGKEIKRGNGYHIKKCVDNYVLNMTDEEKEEYKRCYIDEQYSIADMSNNFNFPSSIIYGILKRLNIETRSVKEAKSTKRVKEKYEKTCIEHFGCSHNFSKNSASRKLWEERLYNEEGITNVFLRKEVKEKIRESLYNHYGQDALKIINSKEYIIDKWINVENMSSDAANERWELMEYNKGNGMRISYYIEKYGNDEGYKKYLDVLENRYLAHLHSNKSVSKLNKKFKDMLDDLNIQYILEFPILYNYKLTIKTLYYDFKIDNTIFELNGNYWHASPKIYNQNDILHFPNNNYILAKDIWKKDEFKKYLAELNGYNVIYIWEDDILNNLEWNNIIKIFKNYANSKDKIN